MKTTSYFFAKCNKEMQSEDSLERRDTSAINQIISTSLVKTQNRHKIQLEIRQKNYFFDIGSLVASVVNRYILLTLYT
jgi:hypothetical protein